MVAPDRVISTGVAELDKMLGGGLNDTMVVLLRGGPGSGKTTLAMQIVHNIVSAPTSPGVAIVVSLETPPGRLRGHMKSAYGIDLTEGEARSRVKYVDGELLLKEISEVDATQWTTQGSRIVQALWQHAGTLTQQFQGTPPGLVPKVIVFDSLVVLPELLRSAGSVTDDRQLFRDISSAARKVLRSGILMLIGEYDTGDPRARTVFGESFFCDLEVALSTAEVPLRKGLREERFFCRVVKAREQNRQVRRCSYDFVDKKGMVFYETYPGDGRVVLFQENAQMREEWDVFERRDIPDLYPTLAFETFDRSGLQRTFASHRRLARVPQRANMLLHSFDTYWVNWYAELCQRTDIARIAREEKLPCALSPEGVRGEAFSEVVGKLHRACVDHIKKVARFVDGMPAPGAPVDFSAWASSFPETSGTIDAAKLEHACALGSQGELEAVDVVRLLQAVAWSDRELRDEAQGIFNGVCNSGNKPGCPGPSCKQLIEEALRRALDEFDGAGLLLPIPFEELRLYGERKSGIIHELEEQPDEGRPIFRPYAVPKSTHLISVPYNANMGLMVVNQAAFEGTACALARNGKEDIAERIRNASRSLGNGGVGRMDPSVQSAAQRLLDRQHPETWEEVLVLCEAFAANAQPNACFPFLIESRTFDTYLATFLEVIWSLGGKLAIHPDYEIAGVANPPDGTSGVEKKLVRAFGFFRHLFGTGLTPRDCCLEPAYMKQMIDEARDSRNEPAPANLWLFARHWHSTLVDTLTAHQKGADGRKIWVLGKEHLGEELSLMRIPLSLDEYHRQFEESQDVEHHPCLGEWHLGVLRGSENTALGIDLINNLMSSQKVAQRASQCAAVPTTEEFYTMYRQSRCLSMPDRRDIQLPSLTWDELRTQFLSGSRSRTAVFDYRHSMREFHAVLEFVRTRATEQPFPPVSPTDDELARQIAQALTRIQELAKKHVLLH